MTKLQSIIFQKYAHSSITILTIISTILIVYYFKNDINREQEFVKSKKKYESVVNNVKEVVFQTDAAGLWTFLNPSWEEITGFTIQESLGNNFLNYVCVEDRERNAKLFKPLMERKKDHCRHEIRYIKSNGETIWVEVYARLTLDNKKNIVGTSGTITDINDRKLMEKELIKKDKLLQGIAESTNILIYNENYIKAFNLALAKLGETADVDRVYIFENHEDSDTGELLTSQSFEWSKENIKPQIDNPNLQNIPYEGFGIKRWYNILSMGETISGLVKDFPQSEKDILIPQGIVSLLAVPIMIDGKFYGFIGFDDCKNERKWSEIEINTLLIASAGIGAAFKRRQFEKSLQEALESDYKRTVKNLQNLVFKYRRRENGEFYYTLFEGKMAENFGKNTENMYGKNLRDEVSLDEAQELESHLNKAFQGIACSYELKYGDKVHYETLSPVFENNKVIEIIGSSIDITDTKNAQEQLKYLAYYDSLTGLPNRDLFKDRLQLVMSHSRRNNEMLSVMFIDLDRFKDINDTLGHDIGDLLLIEVASRLKETIPKDDTVSRMGGDEFTLIIGSIIDVKYIINIAENIMSVVSRPFNINGQELYITTSIGISIYPNDGEFSETLIKHADLAMYRAKEFGRNNYQFFTKTMNEKAVKRLQLEKDIRKAIERNEFLLHFQPQFELLTEKIVGCEALIRWNNPNSGQVSPGEFIPLAEETGLIIPIGEWVLREACQQLAKWNNSGYEDLRMAVNISAQQFEQQDFADVIIKVLKETGINPNFLELELTESTVIKSTARAIKVMNVLKEIGIKISIDDFGTGFSSFGYLQRFSADILKIDRSFIKNMHLNSNDAAIVSAIIDMAHILQLKVIAEGVESEDQMEYLKSINCDVVQGYFVSKPVPCGEFEKLLLKG
jgi:diguanylate cyclase (GGDEF)-like protein/PAS domain S-box-containing protein